MKKLILIVALVMTIANFAFAIGPTYSGSWYNPEQSGHGFSIEYSILDDGTPLFVAYWYVYDSEGNPIFLIGTGEPKDDHLVTLEFTAPYGMKFGEFDPEQTVREDGGSGAFVFYDSEVGDFHYTPSQWMIDTYGVSSIVIPVVKLVEVAHPNDEPPRPEDTYVDSYIGSWTGRMIYDRRGTGTCHDADVHLQVGDIYHLNNYPYHLISITVIRDTGGQATYNFGFNDAPVSSSGYVGESFKVFSEYIDMTIQLPPLYNTGHAEGFWNYQNGDCYGEWTFTKD